MCGITGFIDFNGHTREPVLHSMTDALYHRGPDDGGYFYIHHENQVIGLGHRRLSILDLSANGHQPMMFNNLTITYNGEIYNFNEIRTKLEEKGYRFDSNTDTEVILKAYHCWGIKMLNRFNGMFAFALYDNETQRLTLVRDRAGVKPLYYYFKGGLFLFASELKSFHQHPQFCKELNNDGLALFLQYGYILQPHTIYRNCYKLKGGHYLTLDLKNQNIVDIPYWDVMDCYRQPKFSISEEEAIDETEKILKSAFEYRMVSDVPVGLFLSGGYDSSTVAAILQANHTEKIKTFTIGFYEKEFNEADSAKKIAGYLGTDHREYYCTQKDVAEILSHLPEIWDEPFGDPSAIPTILVSRLAREKVTVSLSADGGDEIFGGYNKYTFIGQKRKLINRLPKYSQELFKFILRNPAAGFVAKLGGMPNAEGRLKRLSYAWGKDDNDMLAILSTDFTDSDLSEYLSIPFNKVSTDFDDRLNSFWLDNFQSVDYKTYQVDDILTKVDRASMSVSLEGREPMLDHRIIEYVARLDPAFKIKNGVKKHLLKQIAYKYIPKKLLDKPKKGFGIPVQKWCRKEICGFLPEYLNKDLLKKEAIFNVNKVLNLRDAYLSGKKVSFSKLWNILMFQMWKERWL
jgi:asparagine synthase (glutamine-hydrolysing)